jgi:tetratricopeptide (TPR) repeat protein
MSSQASISAEAVQRDTASPEVAAQSALALIVDRARRVTRAEGAAIREVRGDQMVWLARSGLWLREQRYARRCLESSAPVNCPTFRLDSTYRTAILANAVVPIFHRGHPVAVLEVFSTEGNSFGADEVRTLQSIASWAETVLDGARPKPRRIAFGKLLKRAQQASINAGPKWRAAAAVVGIFVLAAVMGDLYVHGGLGRAERHERAGTQLLAAGTSDAAAVEFKQALRFNPRNARAHYALGAALFRLGNYDGAAGEFRRALELQYNLPHAHSGLGSSLLRQDKADAAIIEFYQAIRDDFSDADAHYYLGVLLSSRGMLPDAINEYTTALRFKPEHAPAHAGLAVAYLQRGSRASSSAAARQDFDRAWDETHAAQMLGAPLDPSFLASLRGRLPDPAP